MPVFVDGPHILQPVDVAGSSIQELGAAEASTADPALTPRAWWKSNEAKTISFGLQESLALLRDILKADRYEVRRYFLASLMLGAFILTAWIRASLGSGTLNIIVTPSK